MLLEPKPQLEVGRKERAVAKPGVTERPPELYSERGFQTWTETTKEVSKWMIRA